MAECDSPAEASALTHDLLARKAVTRELGAEPLPAAIAAFINQEFDQARAPLRAATRRFLMKRGGRRRCSSGTRCAGVRALVSAPKRRFLRSMG
jgi:hypothetical protein